MAYSTGGSKKYVNPNTGKLDVHAVESQTPPSPKSSSPPTSSRSGGGGLPSSAQSGGTYTSDQYGNLVKTGSGTGSSIGGREAIGYSAAEVSKSNLPAGTKISATVPYQDYLKMVEQEKQQRIAATLKAQGQQVNITDRGLIEATAAGRTQVIQAQGRAGESLIRANIPASAKYSPGFEGQLGRGSTQTQSVKSVAESLREKTILKLQKQIKEKGGLQGVQIIPQGAGEAVIPTSAKYSPGFEAQLGTGKMQILGQYRQQLRETDVYKSSKKFMGEEAKKITRKYESTGAKWRAWTLENLPEAKAGESKIQLKEGAIIGRISQKYTEPFLASGYQSIRQEPLTFAATTAVFGALTFGLGAAGAGISAIPPLRTTWEIIKPSAVGLLTGAYAKSITTRVKSSENPPAEAGKITAMEIIPMAVGTTIGLRSWEISSGFVRTIGKTPVKQASIIEYSVRSGKEIFPVTPYPSKSLTMTEFQAGKFQLPGRAEIYSGSRYQPGSWTTIQNFQQLPENVAKPQLGVWHARSTAKATAFDLAVSQGKGEITIGNEYLPGGFVAPSLSPLFLRIGRSTYSPIATDLIPSGQPKAIVLYPKGFQKVPAGKNAYKFILNKAEKGKVIIPGLKTEQEGLLPPGTIVEKVASNYRSMWKLTRFPIEEWKVVEIPKASAKIALKPGQTTLGELESSIKGAKVTSIPVIPRSAPPYKPIAISKIQKSSEETAPSYAKLYSRSPLLSVQSSEHYASSFSLISRSSAGSLSSTSSMTSGSSGSRSSAGSFSEVSYAPSSTSPGSYVSRGSRGGMSSFVSRSRGGSYSYGGRSETPPPTITTGSRRSEGKGKKRALFKTLVRRRGIFKTVGTFGKLEAAVRFGEYKVKQTAAASFKVVPIEPTEEKVTAKMRMMLSPRVFYASIREPGVFIQRARERISSQGEKGEITFKGIAQRRFQKRMR